MMDENFRVPPASLTTWGLDRDVARLRLPKRYGASGNGPTNPASSEIDLEPVPTGGYSFGSLAEFRRRIFEERSSMQVSGSNYLHAAQPLRQPHYAPQTSTESSAGSGGPIDRLDISLEALSRSREAEQPFRADKVADLRAQIEAGGYDSEEKLDAAVSKMLDELFG
jgi:hypothetical protein